MFMKIYNLVDKLTNRMRVNTYNNILFSFMLPRIPSKNKCNFYILITKMRDRFMCQFLGVEFLKNFCLIHI